MARLDRSNEQRNRLLREVLPEGDALVHRKRRREFGFLT
jgi:hypothetical protein